VANIRKAKKQYYSNLINENYSDGKKLWTILRKLVPTKSNTNNNSSDNINADVMNEFLASNASELTNSEFGSEIASEELLDSVNATNDTFEIHNIDEESVHEVINNLSNTKTSGYDKISSKMLKISATFIAIHLVALINLIIFSSLYPLNWKKSKIVPIFKGNGKRQDYNNFRPIAIQSVISKVFERLLFKQIFAYLEKNHILSPYQFGFKPKNSCTDALLAIKKQIFDARNNNEYVCVFVLDLKKAFDTINHKFLIKKLRKYKFSLKFLLLIKSYFNGRSQAIFTNGKTSKFIIVCIGLCQGSVIGPLLFIIFINDIFNVINFGIMYLFADDMTIVFHHKNFDTINSMIDNDMKLIFKWLSVNRLIINKSKSKHMLIGLRNDKTIVNSFGIEQTNQFEILGVTFDNKLSFEPHINRMSSKISKKIGVIKRIKHLLPPKVLLLLYKSLIQTHLIYSCQLWGFTYDTHINKLISLQNRVIKIISSNFRINTNVFLKNSCLLSVKNLILFYSYIYIFKSIHNLNPQICNNFFRFKISHRMTRNTQKQLLDLPKCKFTYTQNSIFYKGVQSYNSLDINIRLTEKLNPFKKRLIDYLLDF
jgi:hypothetical protein